MQREFAGIGMANYLISKNGLNDDKVLLYLTNAFIDGLYQ